MIKLFELFLEAINGMTEAIEATSLVIMLGEVDRGEYANFLEWGAGVLEAIRIVEAVLVFMLEFAEVIG